ncbi:putative transporter C3H1.06c [Beauveria bassiana]|uniref:Putative transporter C3H1.06c n=1 Tax=Beauveria bassiana TaxID=176275 RepID=A0A2N6P021_BEABA|nr:putative transporter C3H1.06c [Beauveria bassiana]
MSSNTDPAQAEAKSQPASTQEQTDAHATETTAEPQAGYRFWLAFWSLALTNLAAAFDATTLSVALPKISSELGGSSTEAFWAGTSYLLATTAMMLIWVTVSDTLGRRIAILTALVVFAAGAIICAVASNWTTMLAGRTIQGVGCGGVVGLTVVLITDLVPLRRRGKLYALISVVWAVGGPIGPIIGGVLSQKGAWRWIFWMNLPIVAVGMAGIAVFLRLSHRQRAIGEALRCFDFAGSALFVASATALLMPITWGGTQYPWSSWQTLVPLLLGILGIVAFGFYEKWSQSRWPNISQLVPLNIFSNHSVLLLFACSTLHGLVLYSFVYYMPEYFQGVKLYSPIVSGVAALPQTVTIVPCAAFVGVVVGLTGRYRWAVWAGWLLVSGGCGLLVLLDAHTSVAQWIFLQAVSGLGIGLLFPSISLAVQASVPESSVSTAATLVLFFRSMGQALGVAIGSAILENQLQLRWEKIPGHELHGSGSKPGDIMALVSLLKQLPRDDPFTVHARDALAASFQVIWIASCALSGVRFLAMLPLKEYDMNREHASTQRFQHDTAEQVKESKQDKRVMAAAH